MTAQIASLSSAPTASLKQKLAHWIPTTLLMLLMGSGGVIDALQLGDAVEIVQHLGYPAYFCSALGVAKLLGVAAILIPGTRTLREWAYAGFTFDVLAATVSIAVVDQTFSIMSPIALAIVLLSRRADPQLAAR